MWAFLDKRPSVVPGELLNSKARSWAATLADDLFQPETYGEATAFLKAEVVRTLEGEAARGAIKNLGKLLLVTDVERTQVFITLHTPEPVHLVKRLLEILFKRFGEHVLKRVVNTVHMLNVRDEKHIKEWFLASEFEIREEKEPPPRPRAHKSMLHEWAAAGEAECSSSIVVYRGAEGLAHVQTQLRVHTSTITELESELESKLATLSLQRDEQKQEKKELWRRIQEMQDKRNSIVDSAETEEERALLRWEINKLEAQYEDLRSDLHDPYEMERTHAALEKAKLEKQCMHDRLDQAVLAVVNYMPQAVLYKVDFTSEAEREELIKDSLPQQHNVKIFLEKEEKDAGEALRQQEFIADQVTQTGLDLMKEGSLPDFRANRAHRAAFLNRCVKVQAQLTGAELKKDWFNKHLSKKNLGEGHCTQCQKPAHATHYLVPSESIWKPISELANEKAKDISLFCSRRCEKEWSEVLICPECGTFEHEKTTGPQSYPSPKDMLDMTAQYQKRLLQEKRLPQEKPKKKDETGKEVEKTIKMWWREVPRIRVPICVTCSATMLPRDPLAPHLHMHRCNFA